MTPTRIGLLCACAYFAAFAGAAPQIAKGSAAQPRQDYNSGEYLYHAFCASCHGDRGAGNGPLADILRVRPSDLTTIAARNGGVFPRDRIHAAIDGRTSVKEHGPGNMPIWGDLLKATEGRDEATITKRIGALVAYIESLQVRKM